MPTDAIICPAPHDNARQCRAQEAAVAQRFAQLLKGPPPPTGPSSLGPRYAGTPEGQRALAEATASLRERHVEFSHTAHHDLLQVTSTISISFHCLRPPRRCGNATSSSQTPPTTTCCR